MKENIDINKPKLPAASPSRRLKDPKFMTLTAAQADKMFGSNSHFAQLASRRFSTSVMAHPLPVNGKPQSTTASKPTQAASTTVKASDKITTASSGPSRRETMIPTAVAKLSSKIPVPSKGGVELGPPQRVLTREDGKPSYSSKTLKPTAPARSPSQSPKSSSTHASSSLANTFRRLSMAMSATLKPQSSLPQSSPSRRGEVSNGPSLAKSSLLQAAGLAVTQNLRESPTQTKRSTDLAKIFESVKTPPLASKSTRTPSKVLPEPTLGTIAEDSLQTLLHKAETLKRRIHVGVPTFESVSQKPDENASTPRVVPLQSKTPVAVQASADRMPQPLAHAPPSSVRTTPSAAGKSHQTMRLALVDATVEPPVTSERGDIYVPPVSYTMPAESGNPPAGQLTVQIPCEMPAIVPSGPVLPTEPIKTFLEASTQANMIIETFTKPASVSVETQANLPDFEAQTARTQLAEAERQMRVYENFIMERDARIKALEGSSTQLESLRDQIRRLQEENDHLKSQNSEAVDKLGFEKQRRTDLEELYRAASEEKLRLESILLQREVPARVEVAKPSVLLSDESCAVNKRLSILPQVDLERNVSNGDQGGIFASNKTAVMTNAKRRMATAQRNAATVHPMQFAKIMSSPPSKEQDEAFQDAASFLSPDRVRLPPLRHAPVVPVFAEFHPARPSTAGSNSYVPPANLFSSSSSGHSRRNSLVDTTALSKSVSQAASGAWAS